MKNNEMYERVRNMPTIKQIIIENKYFKPRKEEKKIKFKIYKEEDKKKFKI